MTFAGVNYGAILIAALAAWFTGAIWYGVFSKPWVAALGKTMDAFKHEQAAKGGSPAAYTPFILAFLANLLMAWVLAGLISHLGANPFTLRNGIISAAFVWLGFVVTTMAVRCACPTSCLIAIERRSLTWKSALLFSASAASAARP